MPNQNDHGDQQLMDDFRNSDEKAFLKLFRRLYPSLCFYALRFTEDQAAAEDITEESFIKIWYRREQFSNHKVLRSFLYSTVRNASLNWLKQKERQAYHKNEIANNTKFSEESILENIVRVEVFNDVFAAFEKLPPKCRKIISMIFFERKSLREVAHELGLSISTVKTQKARGLMLLKNKLTLFLSLLILMK
jgi:RNA polymerase sigma-70 factor (family 1)